MQLLNIHAPFKLKYVQANNGPFMTKELRKVIILRSRLKNAFNRDNIEESKLAYLLGHFRGIHDRGEYRLFSLLIYDNQMGMKKYTFYAQNGLNGHQRPKKFKIKIKPQIYVYIY